MNANAIVVENITIGDYVLIAPNAFVNFDVLFYSIIVRNSGGLYIIEIMLQKGISALLNNMQILKLKEKVNYEHNSIWNNMDNNSVILFL